MARVVKEAEARREEILQVAYRLFMENGYERTSVESITREVDVAKGTFYHYFDSKEDLLAQLIGGWTQYLLDEVRKRLDEVGGNAIDQLRTILVYGAELKLAGRETTKVYGQAMYAEKNRELLHKLIDEWFDRTLPILVAVVERGTQEGLFKVEDPKAMATVSLSLWYDASLRLFHRFMRILGESENPFDEIRAQPQLVEDVAAGMTAIEFAQERLLGLPEGTLQLHLDDYVHAILGEPPPGEAEGPSNQQDRSEEEELS